LSLSSTWGEKAYIANKHLAENNTNNLAEGEITSIYCRGDKSL